MQESMKPPDAYPWHASSARKVIILDVKDKVI